MLLETNCAVVGVGIAWRQSQPAERLLACVALKEAFGIANHFAFGTKGRGFPARKSVGVEFDPVKANRSILPQTTQRELFSELLILADGRVVAHNLTPTFAALLESLNLGDASLSARVITLQREKASHGRQLDAGHGRKSSKYERSD